MSISNQEEKIIISTSTGSVRIEITMAEATPERIADICRPLLGEKAGKQKDFDVELTIEQKKDHIKPKISRTEDITKDKMNEYMRRIPSLREITKYILSRENYEHSFRAMQIGYLGIILIPDDNFPNQQRLYRSFYSKLYRAHKNIKEQYGGEWRDKTVTLLDEPKYKVWWFEKKIDGIIIEGSETISL